MCLKVISKSSCIYLFLKNNAFYFESTKAVSASLSDFFKLVLTVLKTSIPINCNHTSG